MRSQNTFVRKGTDVYASNDGTLFAEYADSVNDHQSLAINTRNYTSDRVSFSVDQAEQVEIGCYSLYNVDDAQFNVDGDNFDVRFEDGNQIKLYNCMENDYYFTSLGNGIISVEPGNPDKITIQKGIIKFGNESVDVNNTAEILIDPNTGFICMNITPPGTYYKTYEDIRKDFAL